MVTTRVPRRGVSSVTPYSETLCPDARTESIEREERAVGAAANSASDEADQRRRAGVEELLGRRHWHSAAGRARSITSTGSGKRREHGTRLDRGARRAARLGAGTRGAMAHAASAISGS